MPKWFLPTLSEIVALHDLSWAAPDGHGKNGQSDRSLRNSFTHRNRAMREWRGAIAALGDLLQRSVNAGEEEALSSAGRVPQGLVLSGPMPILSQPNLLERLSAWTLTVNALSLPAWLPSRLLPGGTLPCPLENLPITALPLLPGDPLANEQFCLVLTPQFSLVMVLGEGLLGEPAFLFSFLPEVVERVWETIRPRILLMSNQHLTQLDALVEQFAPTTPNYSTVMQFHRLMLAHLPEPFEEMRAVHAAETSAHSTISAFSEPEESTAADGERVPTAPGSLDVELIQAIAHEVRTPLTTIRTLTRSLLKRTDLPETVVKRLTMIDQECSEQIDRFGLIFRAVELETAATRQSQVSLTRTSLSDVLQQSIPRWRQQASQRSMTLDVVMPQKMPAVVSDPSMLDKALTSLIERYTRSLPAGSHIQVEVVLAGNQLKLQLQSQPQTIAQTAKEFAEEFKRKPLKSLGQMLMFQPETGSLSLNLSVTKNLFQSLGGRLIVRDRPHQGEIMTVFLPLEVREPSDTGIPGMYEV